MLVENIVFLTVRAIECLDRLVGTFCAFLVRHPGPVIRISHLAADPRSAVLQDRLGKDDRNAGWNRIVYAYSLLSYPEIFLRTLRISFFFLSARINLGGARSAAFCDQAGKSVNEGRSIDVDENISEKVSVGYFQVYDFAVGSNLRALTSLYRHHKNDNTSSSSLPVRLTN